MTWQTEGKPFALIGSIFVISYFAPLPTSIESPQLLRVFFESLHLVQWYTREHILLCLIPAFLIAGAIAVFLRQGAIIRYLGAEANKTIAYAVASVSGGILAVCSCTVLPLFAGIYRMGAGIGPATTFLYAGPAVNILAIILTARVLGVELGIARAAGAVVFSVVIGLIMHLCFWKRALTTR